MLSVRPVLVAVAALMLVTGSRPASPQGLGALRKKVEEAAKKKARRPWTRSRPRTPPWRSRQLRL